MDASLVALASVAGLAMGVLACPLADAIATPRYGVGSDDHDPEDAALAPLPAPTTTRQRVGLALAGAAGMALLAVDVVNGWRLVYFGILWFVYLAAMLVDLQYLRLPNVFTFPALVISLAGAYALSAYEGATVVGAWIGAAAFAGFLWFARVAFLLVRGREGMGLGDVKLALSLGASVGWLGGVGIVPAWAGSLRLVVYAALLGNVVGAASGLLVLRTTDREFPFGPSLVFGWLVAVAAIESLIN